MNCIRKEMKAWYTYLYIAYAISERLVEIITKGEQKEKEELPMMDDDLLNFSLDFQERNFQHRAIQSLEGITEQAGCRFWCPKHQCACDLVQYQELKLYDIECGRCFTEPQTYDNGALQFGANDKVKVVHTNVQYIATEPEAIMSDD
jgi:hypothetical protein